jgi:hypothetical protein
MSVADPCPSNSLKLSGGGGFFVSSQPGTDMLTLHRGTIKVLHLPRLAAGHWAKRFRRQKAQGMQLLPH